MSPQLSQRSKRKRHPASTPPPEENVDSIATGGPQFGEPQATPDPTKFRVKHGSDKQAYSILDSQRGLLEPRPFPVVEGVPEPRLSLEQALGAQGNAIVQGIQKAGQVVFQAAGDTGNTRGPRDQSVVTDKMVADFDDPDPRSVPSFLYHLGDVVYSFGEPEYYYDQFYDPYRDYPAPIFAIPGNHDGMVSPLTSMQSLEAFRANFCTAGEPPHRTPEAGGLVRTANRSSPASISHLRHPLCAFLGSIAIASRILESFLRRATIFLI